MRVGLYLSLEHGRSDDMAARLRDLFEVVRTARDAGFELLLAGQHFLVPQFQYLQPVPVLARIAVESGRHGDRHGHSPASAPPPGAGRGDGRHPRPGVPQAASPSAWASGTGRSSTRASGSAGRIAWRGSSRRSKLIKRLWTEDRVTFRGEHFRVEDVSIAIGPVQAPRPPILVAATGDRMVRRAATLADAWSAFGHGTLDTLVPADGALPGSARRCGEAVPARNASGCRRSSTSPRRASRRGPSASRTSGPSYDAYRDWGQDTVLPPGESFEGSMAELTSGRFIIGSPDDCLEAIAEHHALLGFRDFCFRLHYPGMPHAQVMRALGLFAERVLPEVRKL